MSLNIRFTEPRMTEKILLAIERLSLEAVPKPRYDWLDISAFLPSASL